MSFEICTGVYMEAPIPTYRNKRSREPSCPMRGKCRSSDRRSGPSATMPASDRNISDAVKFVPEPPHAGVSRIPLAERRSTKRCVQRYTLRPIRSG